MGCINEGNMIAYILLLLQLYEKNYATHNLELGAVVYALNIWCLYLYEVQFEVYIHYKSLTYQFFQRYLNLYRQR